MYFYNIVPLLPRDGHFVLIEDSSSYVAEQDKTDSVIDEVIGAWFIFWPLVGSLWQIYERPKAAIIISYAFKFSIMLPIGYTNGQYIFVNATLTNVICCCPIALKM